MSDVVPIRVLVADDHRLFRDGVRALLAVTPQLTIVGEARDADEAVALALELTPDVVLMDLQMPGGGGFAATTRIAAVQPQVAVLVLTMFEDDESVLAAVRAGARGYLLKDSEPEDLVRAIEAAASGEAIFGRSVAQRMLARLGDASSGGGSVAGAPRGGASRAGAPAAVRTTAEFSDLTTSERNVLALMAQGLSNAVIARELAISYKTVRNYVSSIFRKLQVDDRAQAIVRAREAGLHERR